MKNNTVSSIRWNIKAEKLFQITVVFSEQKVVWWKIRNKQIKRVRNKLIWENPLVVRAPADLIYIQQHRRKPSHPSYSVRLTLFFCQIQPGKNMSSLLYIGFNWRSAKPKEIQSDVISGPRNFHFYRPQQQLRKGNVPPPPPGDGPLQRTVRILLECILVLNENLRRAARGVTYAHMIFHHTVGLRPIIISISLKKLSIPYTQLSTTHSNKPIINNEYVAAKLSMICII